MKQQYLRSRKFISVSCPQCDFNNGGYYQGDITPSRPMSFTCKRDRYWDEKDQQMYSSPNHCGAKWGIAITQKQYEKILLRITKERLLRNLMEDFEKELDNL